MQGTDGVTPSGGQKFVSFLAPVGLIGRIDQLAAIQDRSRSAFIRRALDREVADASVEHEREKMVSA
ncbi:MAG: hypothetical protein V7607_1213 [Solirubrobacteraceae bacterium]